MVTFSPEDGAEPAVEEQARISAEDEKETESPTVEELLKSLGGDDLTEIEQRANEIGVDLEELQKVVGLKRSRQSVPESERWRLPAKLTPQQKVKVDAYEKTVNPELFPEPTVTSAGRHRSAVSRQSRAGRGGTTAQSALNTFDPTPPERKHTEEVRQAEKASQQREENLDFLDKLIRPKWDFRNRNKDAKPSIASRRQEAEQLKLPTETLEKLKDVAHDAFPRRMDLPILICDIRLEGAETITTAEVKDIESYWKTKPADVIIRWIHAPLGNGIVHSSIEDMFRHDQPPGRSFHHAGPPGFPFLDLDSLQFRATEDLEYMRHIHESLHSNKELKQELDESCVAGDQNETFIDDFHWRLKHLNKKQDYWESVLSDIPIELSETFSSGGGEGPIRPATLGQGPLDPSVLGRQDEQFAGTHLTWAPFRCFHRKDGVLLTMTAATGIDLLHRDFRHHIMQPMRSRMQDPEASVVGSQMRALEKRGADDWYQLTVEYFLIHLVTEIGNTPHNMLSGHSTSSLVSALKGVNRDLKIRRYQHQQWQPGRTSKLVQDYNVFQDELRALSTLFKRRVAFFKRLLEDVGVHAAEDKKMGLDRQIHNENGMKPADRVKWAIKFNKQQIAAVDALLEDTKCSIEPFFKLSTIQQNDLAITNDRRNKAILVFTAVTVIFLPLSFFSSYWGTNFQGIRDTVRTEYYFWKVGGSLTAAIVSLLGVIAYWSQIWFVIRTVEKSMFRKRRGYFEEKQPGHKV